MEIVREGAVEVDVPGLATDGREGGVFFNPEMELNRDITVAVLRAIRDRHDCTSYLDAMTATGIRAARAAAEGWDVTAVDIHPEAVELTRENLRRNGLDAAVRRRDANVVLHEDRFDVVDVDPFGSPVPYADAAMRGTGRLLCVTATDTAPLCGAHFRAGVRRYGAVPRNTEYHAEMGLRILLSALVRTAARYDLGLTPLLSHATGHYARTYLEVAAGAQRGDGALEGLGHIHHCQRCLYREARSGLLADGFDTCPACGEEATVTAGPVWLEPVGDRAFVESVSGVLDETMGTEREAGRLLERLGGELSTPTHYDQHRLCKRWGRSAGPMDAFLDALEEAGFEASRTHYGGTTFKTTAPVHRIEEATACR